MNRKVITIIIVIGVMALCALAMIYAPSIMEIVLRFHGIPQH
jgi:hypothetical protein